MKPVLPISLSFPTRVVFESGEEIRYSVSSSGKKLSEVYVAPDGSVIRQRDFLGRYELTDGALDRIQVDGGYIDPVWVYHRYVDDYQGNIVAVINTNSGIVEQFNDYYPYGQPHADTSGTASNRRKFSGKEMTTEFGFNSLDYGARLNATQLGGFISVDPKAEDYPSLSPYSYCGGDPVNYIDPTSKDVFVLINSNGFHLAMLIQDENGKWQYYSVNGNNVYISGTHWGGRKFNDVAVGSWDSPKDFLNSPYNREFGEEGKDNKNISNYEFHKGYLIASSKEQDRIMRESFTRMANTEYDITENNCSFAVQKTLSSASIPTAAPSLENTCFPMSTPFGLINVYGATNAPVPKDGFMMWPSDAYKSIVEGNPGGKTIKKYKYQIK